MYPNETINPKAHNLVTGGFERRAVMRSYRTAGVCISLTLTGALRDIITRNKLRIPREDQIKLRIEDAEFDSSDKQILNRVYVRLGAEIIDYITAWRCLDGLVYVCSYSSYDTDANTTDAPTAQEPQHEGQ